jgi:hypothetical protein
MNGNDAIVPSASPALNDSEQDRPENCARISAIPDKTEWRMRMLEAAAEAGLDILHEIRRRALAHGVVSATEAPETLPPEGDLGLVYPRIQRAIRQAVALHARFEAEFRVHEREDADEARRVAALPQPIDLNTERKKATVRRAVKKAIDIGIYDPRDRESFDLFDDLDDRLEAFDDYDSERPIGAIVENICNAVGLQFDPALWEHEPWAVAEAKTKPAGSPYANWPDPDPEQDNEDDEFGLAEVKSTGTGPP